VCRGFTTASLAKILLGCRRLPPRSALYTIHSLPPAQVKEVKDALIHAPLPDDVFFDGRAYVSMDGTRSELHPDIDEAITKLLDEMNAEVHRANAVADAAAAKADAEGASYLAALG